MSLALCHYVCVYMLPSSCLSLLSLQIGFQLLMSMYKKSLTALKSEGTNHQPESSKRAQLECALHLSVNDLLVLCEVNLL